MAAPRTFNKEAETRKVSPDHFLLQVQLLPFAKVICMLILICLLCLTLIIIIITILLLTTTIIINMVIKVIYMLVLIMCVSSCSV